MDHNPPDLRISKSSTATITRLGENSWHLEIPPGTNRQYRIAQLDDHGSQRRRSFPWQPPLTFSLQARVSAEDLPGTWGFGLWNDPFSFLLAYNRLVPRLPTLPQAAWFFHASPHNYLSFRDDLPANGLLAAIFKSVKVPPLVVGVASPVLILSLIPRAAQWVRKLLRQVVQQETSLINTRLTEWHAYRLVWTEAQVKFYMDEVELLHTELAPRSPLSLVIWVDNQYAALPPVGGVKYGYLPNLVPAWLEIKEVSLQDHAEI